MKLIISINKKLILCINKKLILLIRDLKTLNILIKLLTCF